MLDAGGQAETRAQKLAFWVTFTIFRVFIAHALIVNLRRQFEGSGETMGWRVFDLSKDEACRDAVFPTLRSDAVRDLISNHSRQAIDDQ
jgi:hypothetical protein